MNLVFDTMKKAVGDILPLGKAIRKKHKSATDAIAEAEMAFGPDNKIIALANQAELKLRAAGELADSAADDLISVIHKIGGAVPKEGAQIKLFKMEEGGFRVVIENANPPADPNSERSTDSGGAFEKPEGAEERERLLKKAASAPNQLSLTEEEAAAIGGDSLPDNASPEAGSWPPEVIAEARKIAPKLSEAQRSIIDRLSSHDSVTPGDLSAGERNSVKGLIRRNICILDEAANKYKLSEIGWSIADFQQSGGNA